ncbi:hypothetical protein AYWB_274 [Aster yellows witches'-broom phytoplasma AYWB]|uniref:Uncharacterized protein n=3 Tax=16SrI (Aster yellows group) TaxID=3042590 RepID=Q2NJK2_AYWBP|nr:hypothetical protein AYWB_274 [Aster yellows witches'-broom phytoplasma AYWB]
MKMTDSNFTIGFMTGAVFVTVLCFIFKHLFFSFLQLFNPNDTHPFKRRIQELPTPKPNNTNNSQPKPQTPQSTQNQQKPHSQTNNPNHPKTNHPTPGK